MNVLNNCIMKKVLRYITLCATLSLASCNDWLDVKPETQTDEKEMFESVSGFKNCLLYTSKGKYTYGTGEDINIDANVTLSYSKIFHEKHKLYAGFDYSIAQKKNHFYTFIVEGFPDSKLDFIGNALQYEKNGVPKGTEELDVYKRQVNLYISSIIFSSFSGFLSLCRVARQ